MGMFDSFYDKSSKCPKCYAKVEEWQTSKLESLFEEWKKGDFLQYRKLQSIPEEERRRKYGERRLVPMFRRTRRFRSKKPLVQNGKVPVYTSCRNCEAWLEGYAKILDGKFVGIVEAEPTHEEKELFLIKPETTATSLREEFGGRLSHLQESCKHQRKGWMDLEWAPGHLSGRGLVCLRCEKLLKVSKRGVLDGRTRRRLNTGEGQLKRGKYKETSSREEIHRILSS